MNEESVCEEMSVCDSSLKAVCGENENDSASASLHIERKPIAFSGNFIFTKQTDASCRISDQNSGSSGIGDLISPVKDVENFYTSEKPCICYECDVCTEDFASPYILKKHQFDTHEEKSGSPEEDSFKICKETSVEDFSRLINRCVRYVCNVCKKRFSSLNCFKNHQTFDHEGRRCLLKNRLLDTFEKTSVSNDIVDVASAPKNVENSHGGRIPYGRYRCHVCGQSLPSPNSLRIHLVLHKSRDQVLQASLLHLREINHIRKTHMGALRQRIMNRRKLRMIPTTTNKLPDFQTLMYESGPCDECKQPISRKDVYMRNFIPRHSPRERILCDSCKKTFDFNISIEEA